ncbi:MAG TPA: cyclic nucleotide-binding domain-containing protein [Kofleriaceae bacterium]|nr:cyclic nucleotide-binding domain-containing protein [Kofleriaceae bacterium]
MNRRAYIIAAITLFGANTVAVALRAHAEAAFLGGYGAKWLPLLLVGQAVAFAVGTTLYDAVSSRAAALRVDRALVAALVAAAAVAGPLVSRGKPWPFVVALGVVAVSSVVNLALWNTVCASVAGRDARRWLPRAGACVTAGGAIAGLGAAALVRRASADAIPWIACGVAVVVVGLTVMAQRALAAGGSPGATAPPGTSATAMGPDHRALLRWLALAAVLEAAVATAFEFKFGASMKARFKGDDLVTAVSLFYGGTHLLLLLLQTTIVPRLLTSRALPVTVSIHPVLSALGAGVLAVVPGFAGIAIVRTGDWVLRAATSRTGQEISLSSLPPVPRARWKVLLRGAATPAGAAMAGAVLYVVVAQSGPIAAKSFAGAVAGVIVVWLVIVRRAARSFLAAMAAPLGMRGLALRGREREGFDLDVWTRLVAAAGDPDPRAAELARAALARSAGAADEITPYLADEDPGVRRALYELAARRPRPSAQAELRAAAQIEDDELALAAALDALAAHGSKAGIEDVAARGIDDAGVARAVAAARAEVAAAGGGGELARAAAALVAHDGPWAARMIRASDVHATRGTADTGRGVFDDAVEAALQAGGEARRQGLRAAVAGGQRSVSAMLAALRSGDRDAAAALADLDASDAGPMRSTLGALTATDRAAIARARASALAPGAMLLELASDEDDDVRAAALRTLVGHARGGASVDADHAAAALDREHQILVALLAARPGSEAPALHVAEVERAIKRALRRVVFAVALATAAAGRDPAPALGAGRRVVDAPEAARRRALDVLQELATAPLPVLDTLERALRAPPGGRVEGVADVVATADPWLAGLLRGDHAGDEPALGALRSCRFFDELAGRHAASLARDASHRTLADGDALVRAGEPGDAMFVVLAGQLRLADDAAAPPMAAGSVVGELALVDDAPRAATLLASGPTDVLVVDRAAFLAALDRWPELGLALLRTLASRMGS